jgi:hypothetical protein
MRIYLSGKISGNDNYKEDFAKAEAAVRKLAKAQQWAECCIVNPVTDKNIRRAYKEANEAGFYDYAYLLSRCIAQIRFCSAIVMLPNWTDSKGAKAELAFAKARGADVYFLLENGAIEAKTDFRIEFNKK